MASNLSLRSILDANKLTGPNFIDWFRNIKIVLKQERKAYVLDDPIPEEPPIKAIDEERRAYQAHIDDLDQATCVMLASMSPELQKQHESMNAQDIILNLRELFDKENRTERFDVSKELFRATMSDGSPVRPHVLKMIGCITRLEQLGWTMDQELSIDLILSSLPESYSQFVLNFNMNRLETTLSGLLKMLTTAEKTIVKGKASIHLVSAKKGKQKKKKFFKKDKYEKNFVSKTMKPTGGVKKDKDKDMDKGACHHCGKVGHWRRNCKEYIQTMKQRKLGEASTSGINHMMIYLSA